MKRILICVAVFFGVYAGVASAQSAPNCNQQNAILTASGAGANYAALSVKCVAWTFSYFANGFSALSVQVESAPDNNGVPGAFTIIPAATSTTQGVVVGAQPMILTTFNSITIRGFFPWLRVNLTSATGTGSLNYTLIGNSYIGPASGVVTTAPGAASQVVFGPDAVGAAPTQNPIQDSGVDNVGNVRRLQQDTSGALKVITPANNQSAGDAVTNGSFGTFSSATFSLLGFGQFLFDGATQWNRIRQAGINTIPVSTQLTGRNSIGAQITEKGSRWTVVSTPAVSVQASASIAAEASVRHVADCITFSAGATTAPALTKLNINLRDGATGAGTILASYTIIIPAVTGQSPNTPTSFCGLNLAGTTNTAMTLEFSALLTNLFEDVTLNGYNIN